MCLAYGIFLVFPLHIIEKSVFFTHRVLFRSTTQVVVAHGIKYLTISSSVYTKMMTLMLLSMNNMTIHVNYNTIQYNAIQSNVLPYISIIIIIHCIFTMKSRKGYVRS